ncbi:MAG: DNA gyrase subunit A [Clostridiales bacterium]|jgi:DNA gyrase subunit A|nr:DNA gyrase subunit A [Clostridiales bacterium]
MNNILNIQLETEMKDAFINYAMSVIMARALPDARDGLKPVHRRILHSMNELNLDPDKPYKKSARIVGDVMGKYHPHGEASIYDALVRMAQDFSMRYMLVDGHGNFGSVDGYPAAAQRYTEARLSKLSMEMLKDIDKDTVDFVPNYDGEFKEPTVMPSRVPNLLINGANGIAVGMATNIPPHNLREVVSALLKLIENTRDGKETEISELTQYIKGPDFPTGGTILGHAGIRSAYHTGRGKITVRAGLTIEQVGTRQAIVVTELPYMVNKTRLVEKIADLVKEKRVDGLHDLRDESDRLGIRIVIEVKKDANASVVLNNLYKHCQLQDTFSVIMLALVNGEPKVLNLKEALKIYLDHQKTVVERRTRYDLNKALARAHIVEGFLKALDHIDEIIAIIRAHREIAVSKGIIMERFGFSKEQADAIAEMRLRALSGLERERLENEYAELLNKIKEYQAILGDEKILYTLIHKELTEVMNRFGDERRTVILAQEGEIDDLDLIDDEACVVTMTHLDYIKRVPVSAYKTQKRGGKGVIGMSTRDEDAVKDMYTVNAHDELLFFTSLGRAYRMRAYEIPMSGRGAKGTPAVNLLSLGPDEKVTSIIPIRDESEGSVVMVTKNGIIKKTSLNAFRKIKTSGIIAINIKDGDALKAVFLTQDAQELLIATVKGRGLRFRADKVREMGRQAAGVKGIKLTEGDSVAGAVIATETNGEKLLVVCENGYGKLVEYDMFTVHNRGGMGVKVCRVTEKTGNVAAVCVIRPDDEIMIITSEGVIIRIKSGAVSTYGREAQGVRLINLDSGVTVAGVTAVLADSEDNNEEITENE